MPQDIGYLKIASLQSRSVSLPIILMNEQNNVQHLDNQLLKK